eukprot:1282694-Amphidinium_carterae.1
MVVVGNLGVWVCTRICQQHATASFCPQTALACVIYDGSRMHNSSPPSTLREVLPAFSFLSTFWTCELKQMNFGTSFKGVWRRCSDL